MKRVTLTNKVKINKEDKLPFLFDLCIGESNKIKKREPKFNVFSSEYYGSTYSSAKSFYKKISKI
ncbi:hypothetical protein HNP38_003582 [Chryseobacterium defluvii]|uniref:Uncharacterized protein n=1 Tax=Chryseobacterium defluvii TaxID=160396 RepID=A0A840KFX0_9FLAO|nr:hypothetical protein [Chryseobacterium defluvii]